MKKNRNIIKLGKSIGNGSLYYIGETCQWPRAALSAGASDRISDHAAVSPLRANLNILKKPDGAARPGAAARRAGAPTLNEP